METIETRASNRAPATPRGAPGTAEATAPTVVDLGFDAARPAVAPPPRRGWERRLVVAVVVADITTILVATLFAWAVRYRLTSQDLTVLSTHVSYAMIGLLAVPVWLGALALGGAYDRSLLGSSADEYSRVVRVSMGLLTAVSAFSFLIGVPLSRGLIAVFFPVLAVVGVLDRFLVRKVLHRQRGQGRALRRIVVVGEAETVNELAAHLDRSVYAGYEVVAAYVPGGEASLEANRASIPPLLGEPDQLVGDLDMLDIDAIAVTGQRLFQTESMRSLAWRLQGTGIELLMAPDLVDIAGPRIVTRPAGGLPMLLVEEPRTSGVARLVKSVAERVTAAVGLAVISPLMIALALAVKLTSPGPVLFRQARIGREGRVFKMLKFRSMVDGADALRAELDGHNELDGPLFKMREDPRVTGVGRWMRRLSLDELPQLWNVVTGDMSLVGPRPPLPSEVASYGGDIGRRLMVKPGITGLWQVSGRAELSWTEAVRLDLYYVENWSLTLDLVILAKTAKSVLRGRGAY